MEFLNIYMINLDGSNLIQLTNENFTTNWAPVFMPNGYEIMFSSNIYGENKKSFHIVRINLFLKYFKPRQVNNYFYLKLIIKLFLRLHFIIMVLTVFQ